MLAPARGRAQDGCVPIYDVRCRTCGDTFEVNRPMARAGEPAPCPAGHDDTVRLLPTVAVGGLASAPAGAPARAGGGCCGGACGCGG